MKYLIPIIIICICFVSCDESTNDSTSRALLLNVSGLRVAGPDYDYFLYADLGNDYKYLGSFDINTSGNANNSFYNLSEENLAITHGFLITLQLMESDTEQPSGTSVLRGNLINKGAPMTVVHDDILPINFESISGSFFLETPTDNDMDNHQNGLWFGNTESLLDLPELPNNWTYESWVLLQDTISLSLGKFRTVSGSDDSDTYSGSSAGYNYPGEDFLVNSPDTALDFPYDLRQRFTWISVEPIPDNDVTKPFGRRLLQAFVDKDLESGIEQELSVTSPMFPQGLIVIQ